MDLTGAKKVEPPQSTPPHKCGCDPLCRFRPHPHSPPSLRMGPHAMADLNKDGTQ